MQRTPRPKKGDLPEVAEISQLLTFRDSGTPRLLGLVSLGGPPGRSVRGCLRMRPPRREGGRASGGEGARGEGLGGVGTDRTERGRGAGRGRRTHHRVPPLGGRRQWGRCARLPPPLARWPAPAPSPQSCFQFKRLQPAGAAPGGATAAPSAPVISAGS